MGNTLKKIERNNVLQRFSYETLPSELRSIIAIESYRCGWTSLLAKTSLTCRAERLFYIRLNPKIMPQFICTGRDEVILKSGLEWRQFKGMKTIQTFKFRIVVYKTAWHPNSARFAIEILPAEKPTTYEDVTFVRVVKSKVQFHRPDTLVFECAEGVAHGVYKVEVRDYTVLIYTREHPPICAMHERFVTRTFSRPMVNDPVAFATYAWRVRLE
jgi:hypothetical protein